MASDTVSAPGTTIGTARIISADCHVNEPPHVFEGVPAAFQGAAPDHIVALPMLPVDDGMDVCIAELDRCVTKGARAGFIPGFPIQPYHSTYYDPLYARAAVAGMPLTFHRTFGGKPSEADY